MKKALRMTSAVPPYGGHLVRTHSSSHSHTLPSLRAKALDGETQAGGGPEGEEDKAHYGVWTLWKPYYLQTPPLSSGTPLPS